MYSIAEAHPPMANQSDLDAVQAKDRNATWPLILTMLVAALILAGMAPRSD